MSDEDLAVKIAEEWFNGSSRSFKTRKEAIDALAEIARRHLSATNGNMTVANVLMKIAKAQKDLHRLAQQMLREDQGDGIRWTNWMDKHGRLFRRMVSDSSGYSDLSEDEQTAIEEAAR